MVRLMVTSKRVYAKATFLDCCRQCACPCGEPLLTHASTGDPSTLPGGFVLVESLVGSLLLSSGSWCMQDYICALHLRLESYFPQSNGSPIIKSH